MSAKQWGKSHDCSDWQALLSFTEGHAGDGGGGKTYIKGEYKKLIIYTYTVDMKLNCL